MPRDDGSDRPQERAAPPIALGRVDDGERTARGPQLEKPPLASVTLPTGGGAIRGIGEKFAANPATGTASLNVPLPVSPGRSGFAPELTLSYDSGSGNGPFGFGWSLSTPSIVRKTDKGLPEYRDADESDVFQLAGAEDLVPLLLPNGQRHQDDTSAPGFRIHRYRPRIEGSFARIERWTETMTGHVHWRSITRDNVTTLYGRDNGARVFDPDAPLHVFRWLISESYDDKGNALVYEWVPEDDAQVDRSRSSESNRVHQANRYVKRIKYGNRVSRLVEPDISLAEWLFEVVFDYDEGHLTPIPLDPNLPENQQHRYVRVSMEPAQVWRVRRDAFSHYRSCFEVRTYRRCRRMLMFHRFAELGPGPCLVSSMEFQYSDLDYSFMTSVTQSGHVRQADLDVYLSRSLPSLELEYSRATIQDEVRELDSQSLANLPVGLDNIGYRFIDLDGEGISGILSAQGNAWFYKPNLGEGRFGPVETVGRHPSWTSLRGDQRVLDLAGDGSLDLVSLDGPAPGFFERTMAGAWEPFRAFRSLPNVAWQDPNLRLVDLDGDGLLDALITEDELFTWYPSLGKEGFGAPRQTRPPYDEERGPHLVFADGTQSIYLADMSGDGLADLVRVRNGEVCYWPNLGYGRFGAKVTMDGAPWFDAPDQFEQQRIRMVDVDGSGTIDVIYLGRDGVRVYFNRSGNAWSAPQRLNVFPRVDDVSAVNAVDLFGNGTACLVWSSTLANDATHPLRYVDLMGGDKPHLLLRAANHMGAETRVRYASSTRFYLADKQAGRPWLTRIPFPVHVVERVETYDRVSRNRFVTRYAYHHGDYDGLERELRGFALVEQTDTEEFAALAEGGAFPAGDNVEASSHVPPMLTKSWYHTGTRVARDYARDYYREPGLDDEGARALLLDDTSIPTGLTAAEEREACRALKGSLLRRETYALDGTAREPHPYSVTEQSYVVELVQPRAGNEHAVFFTHARETVALHYERVLPPDPRVSHSLTLEVDAFGNVLRTASITYGRRTPDPSLPSEGDRDEQAKVHVIYGENRFTNAVDSPADYRTPLTAESRTYEISGLALPSERAMFTFEELAVAGINAATIDYESAPTGALEKRLIAHSRTLYRRDDLGAALPLLALEPLALPFESYKLAFTPGLVTQVFETRVDGALLDGEGGYVHTRDENGVEHQGWWIPSGRVFHAPAAAPEPAYARAHFFLAHRARDAFQSENSVTYDAYDLLVQEAVDAVGNRMTAGERNVAGVLTLQGNDYRTLKARVTMDANRNRAAVAFDALGMVVATAVLGKPAPAPVIGDSLAGIVPDLTEDVLAAHFADPLADPLAILKDATTRLLYDLFAYERTQASVTPQPLAVYVLTRASHASDPVPAGDVRVQHALSYSDGFGRVIQKKGQAEPDPDPRWIGTGWTVFNNKGKAVRQFEPFFTATHRFEFDVRVGVSPVMFYDPAQRLIGTLRPDHTWDKVAFDPWRREKWDSSDTVAIVDPKTDPHVGVFFARLLDADYLPTWRARRIGGALGLHEQQAAEKATVHAATPSICHADATGRTFLEIAHARAHYTNAAAAEEHFERRTTFDIEGNERELRDDTNRVVMTYAYDMLKHRVSGDGPDGGARHTLNDVTGKPIRGWDQLGRITRTDYDALRRPLRTFVLGFDPADPASERLTDRYVYGEQHPSDEALNLRGKVYRRFDQAGVATNEAYDFKANLTRSSRRLTREYAAVVSWASVDAVIPAGTAKLDPDALDAAISPLVEPGDPFSSETDYDALNRTTELRPPDGSRVRHRYNEAGQLEQLDVNLRGAATGGELDWTPFVTDIDYDAKGQRMRVAYGNGAVTTYDYDAATFRLRRLHTLRGADDLQDLRYVYDPVGNVTHLEDGAQQTIFFRNRQVEPSADYLYDSLYRLIEATGREHLGQIAGAPIPHSHDDAPRVGITWADNDGNAMGTYLERYLYDSLGNITEMQHRGTDPLRPGWTRTYQYDEPNNRLSSTTVGAGPPERYVYDAHGKMTRMPHLGGVHAAPNMEWNYADQLKRLDLGGGGTVHYVYDAGGARVRKVWEKSPGLAEERLYLGGFEVFRRRDGALNPTLERETLHVVDGTRRLATIETRTLDVAGDDPAPAQLIRYQLGNHLGSAGLELDDEADIISYEEYSPYGSTTYQAVRSQTETPKRYRYTGMERDEESGFNHHGARYYAPWLGRWTAADPAGLVDGLNLYRYSRNNPVNLSDPNGMDPPGSRLSLGEFRLGLSTDTAYDPLTAAQVFDFGVTGAFGFGFAAANVGGRFENRWARGAFNALELGLTTLGMYGPTVYFHEGFLGGGHVGGAARYGISTSITSFTWFSGRTSPPVGATPTQQTVVTAAGTNQQILQGETVYARTARFGYFNPQDVASYVLGQFGTPAYSIRSLILFPTPTAGTADDVINYSYNTTAAGTLTRDPNTWSREGIAAASVITALPATALAFYTIGTFVFGGHDRRYEFPALHWGDGGRLTFPHLETLLTSQGTILGASTFLSPGGRWPTFQLGLDVNATTNPGATVSARAYGFGNRDFEFNPYVRATFAGTPGFFGGAELRFNLPQFLGIRLSGAFSAEGGINDPRSEVEARVGAETSSGAGRARFELITSW